MEKLHKIIAYSLFGALFFIGLGEVVFKIVDTPVKRDVFIYENELQYYHTKAELTDSVQFYINTVAPNSDLRATALIDGCEKYDINIIFVLAQGEIESHFGTKGLASKTNSVWNVGAYDNLSLDDITKKYKYAHPNDSVEPYLKLLSTRYLNYSVEEGLLNNFVDVNGNRFASDPNYEERLSYKYKYIQRTTSIDSLFNRMNYYKIRALR